MARILIVDDDVHLLVTLELLFKRAGHKVICLTDGTKVIATLNRVHFDAIILDIVMPKISGWTLLEQVQKHPRASRVPVLMLSTLSDVDNRVRGLRGGAYDYVAKPFAPEELLARVEGLISRKLTSRGGIQGSLENHPLTELMTFLEQNTKSGRLHVEGGPYLGEMVLSGGHLVSARYGTLRGTVAALAMLELEKGDFRFYPQSDLDCGKQGNPKDLQHILMLEVWLNDELDARAQHLPGVHVGLAPKNKPPRTPKALEFLPIVPVLETIHAEPGTNLEALLQQKLASPKMIKLAVAWLVEVGVVQPLVPPD